MENELEVVNIRLVKEPSLYSEQILDSPQAVVELMAKELSQYDREVFKSSILANASAIIGLHNHPSGNVKPSKEDMIVTRKLQKCGQLLGIELLDYIIVGGTNGKMLSFREEKMLNVTGRMDWER
ncbi:JAB domain-containing protein [[Ruminococcus] torques]|uniref:JAB domain-containing protein n=1 Tax=[Ruminococcus] torques TaxID=33039 RepID=UPI0035680878